MRFREQSNAPKGYILGLIEMLQNTGADSPVWAELFRLLPASITSMEVAAWQHRFTYFRMNTSNVVSVLLLHTIITHK